MGAEGSLEAGGSLGGSLHFLAGFGLAGAYEVVGVGLDDDNLAGHIGHLKSRLVFNEDDVLALAEPGLDVEAELRHGGHVEAVVLLADLLRLLALMGIESCTSRERNPEKFADSWQDFRISPMVANLQMVFYRKASETTTHSDNPGNEILVKFLLNEEETTLPALSPSIAPCYYNWNDVKKFWE